MLKRSLFALAIALSAAVLLAAVLLANFAKADDTPLGSIPSYPITLSASEVREFPALAVDFGNLKLHGEAFSVVPISTELGITGAVLIGDGSYSYTPEAGKTFEGRFHSALLRFNPKDVDAIIKFDAGKKSSTKAQAN